MTGPVRYGSVSQARWDQLLAAGWRGRAGDRMEALYPPQREVLRAVRKLNERRAAALADIPSAQAILATVTAVTAGGASDGNALIKVRWRDTELTANSYGSTYTPVVGHRVLCLLVDSQLLVVDRQIGAP